MLLLLVVVAGGIYTIAITGKLIITSLGMGVILGLFFILINKRISKNRKVFIRGRTKNNKIKKAILHSFINKSIISMNKFRDVAIGLLCIVLLGGILWYGYDKYHGTEAQKASESTKNEVIIPTLEERLNDWNVEKHDMELYDLCMELPEQIVRTILNRIGTTATYEEIAEEYLRNTNYYISMQLKEVMPGITGPDAKNAKVEIKTEVNRPEKESEKAVKVPVMVIDSIK